MYDRVYQSKPSSTVQKQNTEKAERKGMYLPSQSFDPFRNQEETMKSEDGKKGMYLPSQSFDPFRNGNSLQSGTAPAQMMEDEQIKKKKQPQAKMHGAQMKEKKKKQIQKKAVQRNSANSFGADLSSKGSATTMPEEIQAKMENSFGADFSNVAIHKDSDSATNMGALAYAQGNEVHFAPGQYNPETRKGQELLGHELTHVVQQRQGRVQATTQGKGMAINDDPALEREADVMGKRATEGKSITSTPLAQMKKEGAKPTHRKLEAGSIQRKEVTQLFKLPAAQTKKYQRLTHYLKNTIQEIANNDTVVAAFKKYGQFSDKQIESALKWGQGPTINVVPLGGGINGEFTPNSGSQELRINVTIVEQLENAVGEDRDPALLLVASTILHEFTHYGDDQDGLDYTDGHGEEGQALEEAIYGRDIDNIKSAKEVLNEYNERNAINKRYTP